MGLRAEGCKRPTSDGEPHQKCAAKNGSNLRAIFSEQTTKALSSLQSDNEAKNLDHMS